MNAITPIYLNHAGIICALGASLAEVERNLFTDVGTRPWLSVSERYSPGEPLPLGLVKQTLADTPLADENTRNNRMLAAALKPLLGEIEALKARHGSHRIGIVVGTSTSGIAACEAALHYDTAQGLQLDADYTYLHQEFSAPARFLTRWLQTSGPCLVLSSACTSGAKALAAAARLLRLGVCDAVLAAGVDTLCRMTVSGFNALSVVSTTPCLPFSRNRCGINIGEGAACFILSREPGHVRLAGVGESSDAYHISAPNPQGDGAILAMRQALEQAQLAPEQIDYLNLHGTATPQNDAMEALAVNQVLGANVPCSSTKPLTGHTLAAAGAIEALFCWLLLQREDTALPPHIWDAANDPALAPLRALGRSPGAHPAQAVMSNSFAFGGHNLSLGMTRHSPRTTFHP